MPEATSPASHAATTENGSADPVAAKAPEVVAKSDTTKTAVEARELLRADAGDVNATMVTMDRSGAESITAERVTMERSGAKSLEAKSAQLTNSGVARLKSERAVLQGGSAMLISAAEVRLVKSSAVVVAAGKTTVEGELKTLVHLGPNEGCIRPVFDTKSAVGVGAAFGVVVLFLGRLFRRLAGSR